MKSFIDTIKNVMTNERSTKPIGAFLRERSKEAVDSYVEGDHLRPDEFAYILERGCTDRTWYERYKHLTMCAFCGTNLRLNMGYRTREIAKGEVGEFSKIVEEYEELVDAHQQGAKIMVLCELSDLYGAIDAYVRRHHGLTIEDVAVMARLTKEAFEEGRRK